MAQSEAQLLRRIARRFSRQPAHVVLGPGDDAALLRVPPGHLLVTSQDDLVEGTHFERGWAQPRLVARKLLGVNLSDLAAMGRVRPLGCMISAGFPAGLPASWAGRFLDGVARASAKLRLPVVGGNLARSERLFFSLSVFGAARPGDIVRRDGAHPGDWVGGIGPLGEAAAGLRLLRCGRVPAWARPLVRAFWEPEPQLEAARRIAPLLSSLMDNSDGLARSAEILCEASGVGMELDLDGAPASPALARWCKRSRTDLRSHQWAGGEDYGLVFTLAQRNWPRLKRRVPRAYLLGRVVRRGLKAKGVGAASKGFEHFRWKPR